MQLYLTDLKLVGTSERMSKLLFGSVLLMLHRNVCTSYVNVSGLKSFLEPLESFCTALGAQNDCPCVLLLMYYYENFFMHDFVIRQCPTQIFSGLEVKFFVNYQVHTKHVLKIIFVAARLDLRLI